MLEFLLNLFAFILSVVEAIVGAIAVIVGSILSGVSCLLMALIIGGCGLVFLFMFMVLFAYA